MIDEIKNVIITLLISLLVVVSYDKLIKKDYQNDEIFVFSGKEIIEYKKLQIKKAILNNEDVGNKEKELETLIKTIDFILEDFSKINNKPVYQREMILNKTNTKDITPFVKKSLEKKGLF